jgi:hypothetical protein
MNKDEKIKQLEQFKEVLLSWNESRSGELRTHINKNKHIARQIIIEAGCFKTFTISPPPIIGGLMMRNVDAFNLIFNPPYGMNVISTICDNIDEAIGIISSQSEDIISSEEKSVIMEVKAETIKNYAFIAMSMDARAPELEDVLDSIKESCTRCGIQAERIDEPESNERITDRILESLRKAEYVIVDLTNSKPNVYYEAGYAQGIGKIPIFIAKEGTVLEFDLKDYPVIFYKNMKELKDRLEKRIRNLSKEQV